MSPLLPNLLHFPRLLRPLGIAVSHGQIRTWLAALNAIDWRDRPQFKAASRATLVRRHEEIALFDRAFDAFFSPEPLELPPGLGALLERAPKVRLIPFGAASPPPKGLEPEDEEAEILAPEATYSPAELLRQKDFSTLTPEEEAIVRRLLRARPFAKVTRKTRRFKPASQGDFDFRRTLRDSLRTGGEPIHRALRRRQEKPRPVVALLDISGSMEPYSRLLLELLYAVAAGDGPREVFAFGTRLTRLTRELRRKNPERALSDASRAVLDWGGGTRIGDSLHRFNVDWNRRVLRRGAIVLLASDGLDRGDPALLSREMAHLSRSCWKLLWLNPLLGLPGYEPLAGGMQAALPWVDGFLPVHNLASLERLMAELATPLSAPVQSLQRDR